MSTLRKTRPATRSSIASFASLQGPDPLDEVIHVERAIEVQVDGIPDVVGHEATRAEHG